MAAKGKFQSAFHESSLLGSVDRELLYQEHKHIWDKALFEYFRLYAPEPNFEGQYLSTEAAGFRKTVSHFKKSKNLPIKNVGVFGASTMFGTCESNACTVPSFLDKMLNESDVNINYLVKNYAVGSYTSTQELLLFIEILENDPIDVAIFVDGASEFSRSYSELYMDEKQKKRFLKPSLNYMMRGVKNNRELMSGKLSMLIELREKLIKKIIGKIMRDKTGIPKTKSETWGAGEEHIHQQVQRTVALYKKNKTIIDAIADAYRVRTLFVLEPLLYTKPALSVEEKNILGNARRNDPEEVQFMHACIAGFQLLFSNYSNCFDITGIFASHDTIFIDTQHTTGKGNKVLAEKVHEILKAEKVFSDQ